jgi:hypothetical protein
MVEPGSALLAEPSDAQPESIQDAGSIPAAPPVLAQTRVPRGRRYPTPTCNHCVEESYNAFGQRVARVVASCVGVCKTQGKTTEFG